MTEAFRIFAKHIVVIVLIFYGLALFIPSLGNSFRPAGHFIEVWKKDFPFAA